MSDKLETVLKHYGVKGMRWGVRRSASYGKGMRFRDRRRLKKMTSPEARKKYLDEKDKKWLDKVANDANAQKVAKRTASDMRKVNKELKKQYGSDFKRAFNRQAQAKFQNELKTAYDDIVANHTFAVYKMSPTRTREVEIKASADGTMKAVVVERINPKLNKQRAAITKATNKLAIKEAKKEASLKHSDDESANLDGMFFIITTDEDGFPDDVIDPFDTIEQSDGDTMTTESLDDVLQHFGVKGMKWDKKKVTPEDKAAIAEGFKSAKEKAEFDAEAKRRKLSPQDIALAKTLLQKMRQKDKSFASEVNTFAKAVIKNRKKIGKEIKKEFKKDTKDFRKNSKNIKDGVKGEVGKLKKNGKIIKDGVKKSVDRTGKSLIKKVKSVATKDAKKGVAKTAKKTTSDIKKLVKGSKSGAKKLTKNVSSKVKKVDKSVSKKVNKTLVGIERVKVSYAENKELNRRYNAIKNSKDGTLPKSYKPKTIKKSKRYKKWESNENKKAAKKIDQYFRKKVMSGRYAPRKPKAMGLQ